MGKYKRKSKEKLKWEVAKELIELYAKTKSRGYAFSKDTPWQQEFENSFTYQETDDQQDV